MKISLNGPPGHATGLGARAPCIPSTALVALSRGNIPPGNSISSDPTIKHVADANHGAQRHFPTPTKEGSKASPYQKYDLRSPPLAPVVRPVAKTTMKLNYLFWMAVIIRTVEIQTAFVPRRAWNFCPLFFQWNAPGDISYKTAITTCCSISHKTNTVKPNRNESWSGGLENPQRSTCSRSGESETIDGCVPGRRMP